MQVIPQSIPEVLLLQPQVFGDERGFFVETARQSLLDEAGLPPLVQHNQSRSGCGVLRGLHYQLVQPQGKLVRCSRGAVFDVAVDVRRGSASFGQWVGAILDDVIITSSGCHRVSPMAFWCSQSCRLLLSLL